MKKLIFLIAVFIIIAAINSCTPEKSTSGKSELIKFEGLITGFTSGIVPADAPVTIMLGKPVEVIQPGSALPAGILVFKPSIRGSATLTDAYTIVFKPDEPLPSGTKYNVRLKLDKLLKVEEDLKQFDFDFQVIKQDFSVLQGSLNQGNTSHPQLKIYEGKVLTADKMQPETLQKLIKATSPYGELKISVQPEGINTFIYSVADIPRREEAYEITIIYNGQPVGVDKEGSFKITIPSVNEFKLMDYKVSSLADQSVQLIFSDPPDPSQNLDGLIYFKESSGIRISKNGSLITIYPVERLTGEKTLVIDANIRSEKGKILGKAENLVVALEQLKPQVQLIGKGTILPDSKGLILPFKAVSLRAVDVTVYKIFSNNIKQWLQTNTINDAYSLRYVGRPVFVKTVMLDQNPELDLMQWNGFSIDLSGLINKDPSSVYRVKLSFKLPYSAYECESSGGKTNEFETVEIESEEFETWDDYSYYYSDWPEDYDWYQRDNPCSSSYYTDERFQERNLLSSNLGIIAKSGADGRFTVFVTDLLTTVPVQGAVVEFFDFQQQSIGKGQTGGDGLLEIKPERNPFLVSATHKNQTSWLRLDGGSSLSMSNFDVSGETIEEGIKGYIYGERGVWRPGDSLFITFVMNDETHHLPQDHPVVFELYDPRGQMTRKLVKNKGLDGFYLFITSTDPEAPTGNWKAKISVGGAVFEKWLKIETIKPNRLKINLEFNKLPLMAGSSDQKGKLKVNWLHGAVAPNLKTKINVRLSLSDYKFPGFEKYAFSDPTRQFWPFENEVFNGKLDANGQVEFPIEMQVNNYAPGMLNATFQTRVFEEGGDFSTDFQTQPLAPFDRFIGIEIPDGGDYTKMLETGKDNIINIASIDKSGKPVSANDLELRIYKVSWRWWWSSRNDNMANWTSGEGAEMIFSKKIATTNGLAKEFFRIDYPEWGRYFVHVIDNQGGHSTGLPVYVDWPMEVNRRGRSNPAGATVLSVSTDKEKYNPGDKAIITFPGTKNSRALISIENGTEVLNTRWIDCSGTEGRFDLEITPEMAPNVYVNISLIQPHAQTVNDLPIRMYGVIPLMVEDAATILHPQITVPEKIRPETNYSITVSEKQGRPMTYTLAVVDDGLLDLTRFKTPDPWQKFFAREALGVRTWDLFDDVLGAYGGRLQSILAIGGDGTQLHKDNAKANRFKPVVAFLGPFHLEKNKKATHNIHMPNYVGSVRVMVVAGKDGAWGNTEATVPVKQPLMLLPTLPRVMGPEEEVDVPVSVFVMDDKIKKVSVSISSSGTLKLIGEQTKVIDFTRPGEEMVYFKVKAASLAGVGTVQVQATAGSESASAQVELNVRNPNPVMTKVENQILEAGKNQTYQIQFSGMAGTNKGFISISGLPSFNLEQKLEELISYPYGCLEQRVSSAFPQLFLGDIMQLSSVQKTKTDQHIRFTINRISTYRQSDGNFSYWPGGAYYSSWSTLYAGHFLLMAEQKGYVISSDIKNEFIRKQYKKASDYNSGMDEWYDYSLTQSYRLYVLALAGNSNFSAMNRLKEQPNLPQPAKWLLASAYLLAGKPEAARDLTNNLNPTEITEYNKPGETFGSSLRDKAIILENLVLMNEKTKAFELLKKMSAEFKNQYTSTQTTAFCIIAFARFAASTGADQEMIFNYSLSGKNENIRTRLPLYSIEIPDNEKQSSTCTITNQGKGTLFVTLTTIGQPMHGLEISENKNLTLSVKYISQEGKEISIENLKQGTDFIAEISVSNPGLMGNFNNVALTQIFPSGWEILNTRISDVPDASKVESSYEYRDIRDDRVNTFFNVPAQKSVKYRVNLNAAYTGKFYLPAINCTPMYDGNVYARQKGQWVTIIK